MGKGELCKIIQNKFGLTAVATEDIVGTVFDEIAVAVDQGFQVTIKGFGTFRQKVSAARTGRNPQTGKAIKIPAKKSMTFKCSKQLVN